MKSFMVVKAGNSVRITINFEVNLQLFFFFLEDSIFLNRRRKKKHGSDSKHWSWFLSLSLYRPPPSQMSCGWRTTCRWLNELQSVTLTVRHSCWFPPLNAPTLASTPLWWKTLWDRRHSALKSESQVKQKILQNVCRKESHVYFQCFPDDPKPPGVVDLEENVPGTVTVTWEPSPDEKRDDRLHYTVSKLDSTKRMWSTVADRLFNNKFTVCNIMLGREYIFRVYAKNDMGISAPSESPTWCMEKKKGDSARTCSLIKQSMTNRLFHSHFNITLFNITLFNTHHLIQRSFLFCINGNLELHQILAWTSVLQKSLSWACRPWGTATCSALRRSSYRWSSTLRPKATNATWAARWAAIPSRAWPGTEITSVWTPIPTTTSPTRVGFAPCWSCEWGPKTRASTAWRRRTRWDGRSAPPCSASKVSVRERRSSLLDSVACQTLTRIPFISHTEWGGRHHPHLVWEITQSGLWDLRRSVTVIHRNENKALFHLHYWIFFYVVFSFFSQYISTKVSSSRSPLPLFCSWLVVFPFLFMQRDFLSYKTFPGSLSNKVLSQTKKYFQNEFQYAVTSSSVLL